MLTGAIVKTLAHSGLFAQVTASDSADSAGYRLSADLAGQRLVGTMSNIMLLLVRYQLAETASGKTIWEENPFSFHHLSASDVFMGTNRVAQTVKTAVRSNLQQLVSRLNAAVSQ